MIIDENGYIDSKLSKLIMKSSFLNNVILSMVLFLAIIEYYNIGLSVTDIITYMSTKFNEHNSTTDTWFIIIFNVNLLFVIFSYLSSTLNSIYIRARKKFKYDLIGATRLSLNEIRTVYQSSIVFKTIIIVCLVIEYGTYIASN